MLFEILTVGRYKQWVMALADADPGLNEPLFKFQDQGWQPLPRAFAT